MEGVEEYFEGVPNHEPEGPRRSKRLSKFVFTGNTRRVRNNNKKTAKKNKAKNLRVSNTNVRAAKRFIYEIKGMPVFLVSGHSCICKEEGKCFGEDPERYFKIPRDTYLATFGVPGDAFCMANPEKVIAAFYEDIRDFMYMHSVSDVIQSNMIGKDSFSLLSNLKRATGDRARMESEPYPNIGFSLNEYRWVEKKVKGTIKNVKEIVPRSENVFGVYRLDTLGKYFDGDNLRNTMSLLPQNEKRANWYLKDIIQETYAASGVDRGIFILAGCLTSCASRTDPTGPHMDRAATAMDLAHNMYNTLCPTLTREDMYKIFGMNGYIPYNIVTDHIPVTVEPSEVKEMIAKGLLTAKDAMKLPLLYHSINLKMLQAMANAE